MPEQEMERELAYFEEVMNFLKTSHEEFSIQKKEIDELVKYSLAHYNSDNPEQFLELLLNTGNQEALTKKVAQTLYALGRPYFARVDFTPDDTKVFQKYYIGKMNLMRGLEILITDWRAPVSSLYYEGRIGRAEYECPDGTIGGEIFLKRQYAIEKGKFGGFTDIDITANDEFLQAALGASRDNRLKDIVTTIQAEQNRIIRAPLFTPLVVQGAAGSGKTTIALHRIAYLLYAHEKQLQPRQVMILAPSKMFLSYISDVLPDLGVERVSQTTFEDFAAECAELPKKWSVSPNVRAVAALVNGEANAQAAINAARLKSRLRFMKLIERYCRHIELEHAPEKDFMLEGYELFTHEALRDLFLREYSYLPVSKRANEIHKNLVNTLKKEKPLILKAIDEDYDNRRESLKRRMPEDTPERRKIVAHLLDERDEKMKRIRYQAKVIIGRYMRRFKIVPVAENYVRLFSEPGLLEKMSEGIFSKEERESLAEYTRANLAAFRLENEDLPPLLLMQIKLFGAEDSVDVKHIVIDEAQDFSLFQLSALKKLTVNASFSILGDLHQGIYSHRGIRSWNDIAKQIFPACGFQTLTQSYRTTVEIMDAANPVIDRLYRGSEPAVPLARPVIRHGSEVAITLAENERELAKLIDKKITASTESGRRSVAVICKTLPDCKNMLKLLKTKPVLLDGRNDKYSGGLIILPSYLAKGFEFDAVIVADVSENSYRECELDIKLLYIAMTRALHELTLFAIGSNGPLTDHLPVINSPPA